MRGDRPIVPRSTTLQLATHRRFVPIDTNPDRCKSLVRPASLIDLEPVIQRQLPTESINDPSRQHTAQRTQHPLDRPQRYRGRPTNLPLRLALASLFNHPPTQLRWQTLEPRTTHTNLHVVAQQPAHHTCCAHQWNPPHPPYLDRARW